MHVPIMMFVTAAGLPGLTPPAVAEAGRPSLP